VAWTDRRQQDSCNGNVEVVAKRCTGQPKPVSCKPQRPVTGNLPSIGGERDTILYTRQQLAERLRRAWREREQSRPNLNIFLAHSSADSAEDDKPTTDTAQPLLQNGEDIPTGGDASLPMPRNIQRDPNSEVRNHLGPQNNISNFLHYSSAVGISKNISVQKNNKTSPLKSNQVTKQSEPSVASGFGESLLSREVNERPKQISQLTERHDKPVPTNSSGRNEDTEDSPLNIGGPTAKINFSVFPKPAFSDFNSEKWKFQTDSNSEGGASETTARNRSNETLHQMMEKYPDVLDVTEGKIVGTTESAVIADTIKFHESPRPNRKTNECDREGRTSNSKIVVDVVPRKKETLSVDCVKPSLSTVYGELSPNTCKENGREAKLANREETKENKTVGNSTSSFVCVDNTDSCEVVESPQTQAPSDAQSMSAAARRVKFRNSVNKAITGSFSSETLPTSAVSSVSRSTPTPPLSRALSAPPLKPGKGILVHRNKNTASVDISPDVTDGEEEALVHVRADRNIMSAPSRRRFRTSGSRRKARRRGEESSGDEAEAGPRQKQRISAGRRDLPRGAEIVTMVSLVSDGSDAEDDATGRQLQPAPCLEDRRSPAEQNQREQAVCLKKLPKSGKCWVSTHEPHSP
jgi:hypothetical protein